MSSRSEDTDWSDLEEWALPSLLTKYMLHINEYLPRHVERYGQVLGCIVALQPQQVMRQLLLMMMIIILNHYQIHYQSKRNTEKNPHDISRQLFTSSEKLIFMTNIGHLPIEKL